MLGIQEGKRLIRVDTVKSRGKCRRIGVRKSEGPTITDERRKQVSPVGVGETIFVLQRIAGTPQTRERY